MQKANILVIISIAALLGVATFSFYNSEIDKEWPNDNSQYTEKEVKAYMYGTDSKHISTMKLRYYNDKPNVPYASISDYYQKLQESNISIEYMGDGRYGLTNEKQDGGLALIDTKNKTISSYDYRKFVNVTDIHHGGDEASIPFVRATVETLKEPERIWFNLGNYGIDIHTDKDDKSIWLPFQTTADLFANGQMYYGEYAGEAVFFMDETSMRDTAFYFKSSDYRKAIKYFITPDKERPADLVEYSYNELCFVFDHTYGNPGLGLLSKLQAEKGFDKALDSYDDKTRLIKQYLKSTDYAEYLAGIKCLDSYFYDGGHTALGFAVKGMEDYGVFSSSFSKAIDEKFDAVGAPVPPDDDPLEEYLTELRKTTWTDMEELGNARYYTSGNIAVYSFDKFDISYEGWKDYYENGGGLPGDCIGYLYTALDKAESDPNIEYFLVDITTNSGGDEADVMMINSLLTGKDSSMTTIDIQTGAVEITKYKCDVNLDGVFDERDHERQYRFNYGILTTSFSFSCGNLLPIYSQRDGVMILGEKSGGGSCNVSFAAIPEGLPMSLSSLYKAVVGYGEEGYDIDTVEHGAYPDAVLIKDSEEFSIRYQSLYDLNMIIASMEQFYAQA